MMTLNRKKLIMMVAGVESFLLGLLVALLASDVINVTLFLAFAVAVGAISSTLLVVFIRKFNE